MDEQSQTELIADLQLQDLQNNEFYCKALSILTVCPLPYYVIRYFYSHYGKWIFNENVFYIISLCFSFQTVPVPVLLPMKEKNYLTIKSTQMSWTYLQQLNIVLSGFMCLASWLGVYFGLDEPIQSHDAFLSTYPFCKHPTRCLLN